MYDTHILLWSKLFFFFVFKIMAYINVYKTVRILACKSSNATSSTRGTELVVGAEKVDSDTEFVILASTGVWEVIRQQSFIILHL